MALNRLGYACIAFDCPVTSNRGTILRRATPERLLDLTASNLRGLRGLLEAVYTCSDVSTRGLVDSRRRSAYDGPGLAEAAYDKLAKRE